VLRVTNAVEAAIIDTKDGGFDFSANVDVSVRPYPWLGYDYNLGGIIAAGVFAIIGTLAFISNVVIIMKSIVVEKELRLREGMQMMGMSSNMYWMSWFFTHWVTGMCTVVLLVIIGTYPFTYTNPVMQLIFYTLWITSCILWNYMISCAFSKSITASVVGCFVYVMSIAPAIAVRITQPNGGSAWLAVCLLPGSSINQWGDILARLELAKAGITFASAGENVNRDGTFTAWAVIGMTFLDCVLYAFATWYLDKTWPKEYGVRLPPWFLFTKKYWFPSAAEFTDVSAAGEAPDVEETGETFEKLPPEASRNASVKIRNLKKTFDNGVVAVDDLSVTFVPGQVSALLGHNGAGKTTTISMLTGMLDATGGDARINGKSIRTDMPAIRASFRYLPAVRRALADDDRPRAPRSVRVVRRLAGGGGARRGGRRGGGGGAFREARRPHREPERRSKAQTVVGHRVHHETKRRVSRRADVRHGPVLAAVHVGGDSQKSRHFEHHAHHALSG